MHCTPRLSCSFCPSEDPKTPHHEILHGPHFTVCGRGHSLRIPTDFCMRAAVHYRHRFALLRGGNLFLRARRRIPRPGVSFRVVFCAEAHSSTQIR